MARCCYCLKLAGLLLAGGIEGMRVLHVLSGVMLMPCCNARELAAIYAA